MNLYRNDRKKPEKNEKYSATENSAGFENKFSNCSLIPPNLKDFLFVKLVMPTESQCFYPIKQLLKSKSLSQIEMRANYAILHYESPADSGLKPFSFLDPILNPNEKVLVFHLNYKLLHYHQFFEYICPQIPPSAKEPDAEIITNWIDRFTEEHRNDAVFMCGQTVSHNQMIFSDVVLNYKFLEFLTGDKDSSFLEEQVLEKICNMFVFNSVGHYLQFAHQLTNFFSGQIEIDISTIAGILRLNFQFQYFFFPKQQKSYFCFLHPKELHNERMDGFLQKNKKKSLLLQKENKDWGKLLSLYYLPEPGKDFAGVDLKNDN